MILHEVTESFLSLFSKARRGSKRLYICLSQERAEQELGKLRQTISQKEGELEKIRPQYEEMKRKEEECTRELSLKEQKRKELYAKQGRGSQFTSKDQRDQWIQKELRSVSPCIKTS